ncbi:hypothetical protein BDN72DRAFT_919097, partial [Pluteus cervinus]
MNKNTIRDSIAKRTPLFAPSPGNSPTTPAGTGKANSEAPLKRHASTSPPDHRAAIRHRSNQEGNSTQSVKSTTASLGQHGSQPPAPPAPPAPTAPQSTLSPDLQAIEDLIENEYERPGTKKKNITLGRLAQALKKVYVEIPPIYKQQAKGVWAVATLLEDFDSREKAFVEPIIERVQEVTQEATNNVKEATNNVKEATQTISKVQVQNNAAPPNTNAKWAGIAGAIGPKAAMRQQTFKRKVLFNHATPVLDKTPNEKLTKDVNKALQKIAESTQMKIGKVLAVGKVTNKPGYLIFDTDSEDTARKIRTDNISKILITALKASPSARVIPQSFNAF